MSAEKLSNLRNQLNVLIEQEDELDREIWECDRLLMEERCRQQELRNTVVIVCVVTVDHSEPQQSDVTHMKVFSKMVDAREYLRERINKYERQNSRSRRYEYKCSISEEIIDSVDSIACI